MTLNNLVLILSIWYYNSNNNLYLNSKNKMNDGSCEEESSRRESKSILNEGEFRNLKTNGFTLPLNKYQIISWVILFFDMFLFFMVIVPSLSKEQMVSLN